LDNKYIYDDQVVGAGVDVFVLDSGIQLNHDDFEDRAFCLINYVTSEGDNDNCHDLRGHGTHIAGVIAGKKYGVAKKANVHAVKVLDQQGKGSLLDVTRGIDDVIAVKAQFGSSKRVVMNLSLGSGSVSNTLNDAVNKAHQAGVVVVSAAGNDGKDACLTSPASADGGMTVGATDEVDNRPSWSNFGGCVDILA
jgi:cerevisin